MGLIGPSSGGGRPDIARARRWVTASLVAAGVLAALMLVNSVRDYLYVSRLLTVRQVREALSEHVVAVEEALRRPSAPALSVSEQLAQLAPEPPVAPLWTEVRRPDGGVLARRGLAAPRPFTIDEESDHFRNREPLYKVVPVPGGEAVVEAFSVYGAGLATTGTAATTAPASATLQARAGPRRSRVTVEVAAPLVVRNASLIWPTRRNLLINCSGALALLAAATAAGFGFRAYVRGRRLETQLEIAREVQSELLPSGTESWRPSVSPPSIGPPSR